MSIQDRRERLERKKECLQMFLKRQECEFKTLLEEIKELDVELNYLQFCIENNLEKEYNKSEGVDVNE